MTVVQLIKGSLTRSIFLYSFRRAQVTVLNCLCKLQVILARFVAVTSEGFRAFLKIDINL